MTVPIIDEEESLYALLHLEKEASKEEIGKAYRRACLRCHPDKVPLNATENEKANAKRDFERISIAYNILTDDAARRRYDRTGDWQTGTGPLDSEEGDVDWSDWIRSKYGEPITKEDIDRFEQSYKGSEEERNDVLQAYKKHKGDIFLIMEEVILGTLEEEPRYRAIIDEAIKTKEVKKEKRYTSSESVAKERQKQLKRARKEEKEAEALARELGLPALLPAAEPKGNKKGEDAALVALIQSRQAARGDAFLSSLEAKYAPKKTTSKKQKR